MSHPSYGVHSHRYTAKPLLQPFQPLHNSYGSEPITASVVVSETSSINWHVSFHQTVPSN